VAVLMLTSIAAVLLLFTISFFRDPSRTVPTDPKLIVAPADGRIVEIRPVKEPHFLGAKRSWCDFPVGVRCARAAGANRR